MHGLHILNKHQYPVLIREMCTGPLVEHTQLDTGAFNMSVSLLTLCSTLEPYCIVSAQKNKLGYNDVLQ